MSEKKPVIVYGVSGYTGRLVCEYLREYNIPFIAAGRDEAKVKAVVEKIPGIETADSANFSILSRAIESPTRSCRRPSQRSGAGVLRSSPRR